MLATAANHCMSFFIALTTIFPPTPATRRLIRLAAEFDARIVIVGDAKGPAFFDCSTEGKAGAAVEFLSLQAQQNGPFALASMLPTNHYARKNIAYLHAIRHGATCIYETDDDNAPGSTWGRREESVERARVVAAASGKGGRWVNAYRYFTDERIWPRGFPLEEIKNDPVPAELSAVTLRAPIQQGLANRMPDVDAIWRLTQDREVFFDEAATVLLSPGNWCPFNTQSTWWWSLAYPALYVPSFCSFRMCDIWKSFVAQRCLWQLGLGIAFHPAEVEQDRNAHDLMKDFELEIPGYTKNGRICSSLMDLQLEPGVDAVGTNVRRCYAVLAKAAIFPDQELRLVDLWLADLDGCRRDYSG